MVGWPLWRRVLWAPVWAVYLVVMLPLFVLFGAWHTLWNPVASARSFRRLRGSMAAVGRTATWEEVERDLSRGPGTIVWDLRTLGWPIVHVWWVPESLACAGGPRPLGWPRKGMSEDVAYDRWLSDRFVSPSTGTGRLLDGASTMRGVNRLRARCAQLRLAHRTLEEAHLWSAMLKFSSTPPKPAPSGEDSCA